MNTDNTQGGAEPSLASAGYADGCDTPAAVWVPKPGEVVRVKKWNQYIVSLARKIADRDAIVVRVWESKVHSRLRATVRFLKRNGRGKEFEETFWAEELIPRPWQNA